MNILLTGATGFIGSHLLPVLLKSEHYVQAIVRDPKEHLPCDVLCADIADRHSITEAQSTIRQPDVCIHLAAQIPALSSSNTTDQQTLSTNVDGTKNILDILPAHTHVIFASTLDVYGAPQSLPLTETHPCNPQGVYAQSKLASEHIAQQICAAKNMPLTILRFTQVYGPGERPIKAIPHFIDALTHNRPPILFGDGSDLRDYLYVEDAVRAIMASLKYRPAGIINIATGSSYTIRSVAERLISISGKTIQIHTEDRRKPKMDCTFDIQRAKDLLHFQPTVTLEEGLRITYDWCSAHAL